VPGPDRRPRPAASSTPGSRAAASPGAAGEAQRTLAALLPEHVLSCPEHGWQRLKYRLLRRLGSPESEPPLPGAQSYRQLPQPQHKGPARPFRTQGSNKGHQQRGNHELSEDCLRIKGSWSFFSPTPPTPTPVSALSLCTPRTLGRQGHPHRLTQGEAALLRPWQPESGSAPRRPLSSGQQPLAQTWRSSLSCLTTNLTALRKGESSPQPVPATQG